MRMGLFVHTVGQTTPVFSRTVMSKYGNDDGAKGQLNHSSMARHTLAYYMLMRTLTLSWLFTYSGKILMIICSRVCTHSSLLHYMLPPSALCSRCK